MNESVKAIEVGKMMQDVSGADGTKQQQHWLLFDCANHQMRPLINSSCHQEEDIGEFYVEDDTRKILSVECGTATASSSIITSTNGTGRRKSFVITILKLGLCLALVAIYNQLIVYQIDRVSIWQEGAVACGICI